MPETEATPLDVQELLRGLRDVAALSALPISWADSDARRIAESLAAALFQMLRLELVYILVKDPAQEIPLEVANTAQGPAPAAQAQEVGRALDPWLYNHDFSRTSSLGSAP